MKQFKIQEKFKIPGIGAASGIVHHDGILYLISDSSNFLYAFDIHTQHCEKIPLSENASDNIPKPLKPDFESLSLKDGKLYAFGSGSMPNRNVLATYDPKTKSITKTDLSALYGRLRHTAGIPESDFNIEGAAGYNGNWLLFQRGNGAENQNGIFTLKDERGLNPEFVPIRLPQNNGNAFSFTDAIVVGNTVYFLAAAENVQSTYLDGEILGSIFGRISLADFSIGEAFLISAQHKFEGLSLWKESAHEMTFFLCEDSDSDNTQSAIYILTVPKTAN